MSAGLPQLPPILLDNRAGCCKRIVPVNAAIEVGRWISHAAGEVIQVLVNSAALVDCAALINSAAFVYSTALVNGTALDLRQLHESLGGQLVSLILNRFRPWAWFALRDSQVVE